MKSLKKKKSAQKHQKKNFKKMIHKRINATLLKHLEWPKSIANFVATTVCALLSGTGVWHKKIAQASEGNTKVNSVVRRLQRHLSGFLINYDCVSTMLYDLLGMKKKVTLILDRTNWKYGEKNINIFVGAALYQQAEINQNFALPLVWEVFNKKGNSSTNERKQLMTKIFEVVGKNNIEVVLADREFIGNEWIQFLHENNIPFVIRIKKMMYVEYNGIRVNALKLVSSVKHKEKMKFNVKIDGIQVELAATRSIDNQLVILIASMNVPYDSLDRYKLRWLIELFFKSIKTKGFNLEETHMTDPARIKSLFLLLTLASFCAVEAGVIRHNFKKIPIKNNGRPTYSLFTYGLDFLRELFRGVIPSLGLTEQYHSPSCFFSNSTKLIFALGSG